MATRGEDLNLRVTSDVQQAIVNLGQVEATVSDLEDRPHTVTMTADTAKAEAEARNLDQRLEGLSDEDKVIVLQVLAKDAQRDIDKITKDLANAHKFDDDEIQMRVSARDDATRRLDAIQAEIREIDGATPTVDVDVRANGLDEVRSLIDDLDGRVGGLGARLAGLGVGSPAIAGVAALAGGLLLAANHSANVALQADEIAKLTGDSVENASRLAAVVGQSGVEAKDLQDILLQMGGVLSSDAELVAQLGINMRDGRSLGERFVQVVELLGEKFDDAGERSVVASTLFGEEGVRQVNAVIARVGDLEQAIANVPQVQIVHPNDVEAARDTQANVAKIKADAESIGRTLGRPALELTAGITGAAAEVGRATQEVGLDIARFFSNARQENDRIITAFNQSEQAAANFDTQLLEGLTTFEQVRAKVIELTGDQFAANLVALQWAESTGWLNERLQAQADTLPRLQTQQDRYVEGLIGAHRAQQDAAESAAENEEAVRRLGEEYANTAFKIVDAVEGRFDSIRNQLRQQDLWQDVIDQLERVEEAAKQTGEEGEESALDYGHEVRRLQGQLLDLLQTYEDLPVRKVIEIQTLIESGDLEAAIDELTQARYIPVEFVPTNRARSAIEGVTTAFGPGRAPSLDFLGLSSPPPQPAVVTNVNTTINTLSSSPGKQYVDRVVDDRRNGIR